MLDPKTVLREKLKALALQIARVKTFTLEIRFAPADVFKPVEEISPNAGWETAMHCL